MLRRIIRVALCACLLSCLLIVKALAEVTAPPPISWKQENLTAEEIQWLEQHPTLSLGIDRSF
ncbi:MAG: hypothetical protein AAFN68_06380, partial [Pseudomonadota bacterium]